MNMGSTQVEDDTFDFMYNNVVVEDSPTNTYITPLRGGFEKSWKFIFVNLDLCGKEGDIVVDFDISVCKLGF